MASDGGVDWERKDRRIAWMNINSACSTILAARIQAGLFKPKDTAASVRELLDMVGIEFNDFLHVCSEGYGKPVEPSVEQPKVKKEYSWFCSVCGTGVSEAVKSFCDRNFGDGLLLCMDCQKKQKEKKEGG